MSLAADSRPWALVLYASGACPRSAQAIVAVRQLCDTLLRGRADLQVVDVLEDPERTMQDGVIAAPTLVRERPLPRRQLVGDLSDVQWLATGLGVSGGENGPNGSG